MAPTAQKMTHLSFFLPFPGSMLSWWYCLIYRSTTDSRASRWSEKLSCMFGADLCLLGVPSNSLLRRFFYVIALELGSTAIDFITCLLLPPPFFSREIRSTLLPLLKKTR